MQPCTIRCIIWIYTGTNWFFSYLYLRLCSKIGEKVSKTFQRWIYYYYTYLHIHLSWHMTIYYNIIQPLTLLGHPGTHGARNREHTYQDMNKFYGDVTVRYDVIVLEGWRHRNLGWCTTMEARQALEFLFPLSYIQNESAKTVVRHCGKTLW